MNCERNGAILNDCFKDDVWIQPDFVTSPDFSSPVR